MASGSDTNTIPIVDEHYSVSKKEIISDAVIEKRWVKKTRVIKVPVMVEEVFVNGKLLRQHKTADKKKSGKQTVPLYANGDRSSLDVEKVIPLFGEDVTISKRMVRLGELSIRKVKMTENKQVRVEITREKAKAEHPSGRVEQLA